MDVKQAIRERRSTLLFDRSRAVPRAQIEELLKLSVWAPNHKLTQPWRFSVLDHAALREMARAVFTEMTEAGLMPADENLDEHLDQFPPMAVIVSQSPPRDPDDPEMALEDYASCCCVAQNVMRAAHAEGIGTMWLTGPLAGARLVAKALGLESDSRIVALIAVGYPQEGVRERRGLRDEPEITWLTGSLAAAG